MDIAKEIKKLLIEEDMEAKDLADLLDTTSQNLSAKLIRNNLRINEIEEIAKLLGYEIEIKFNKIKKEGSK